MKVLNKKPLVFSSLAAADKLPLDPENPCDIDCVLAKKESCFLFNGPGGMDKGGSILGVSYARLPELAQELMDKWEMLKINPELYTGRSGEAVYAVATDMKYDAEGGVTPGHGVQQIKNKDIYEVCQAALQQIRNISLQKPQSRFIQFDRSKHMELPPGFIGHICPVETATNKFPKTTTQEGSVVNVIGTLSNGSSSYLKWGNHALAPERPDGLFLSDKDEYGAENERMGVSKVLAVFEKGGKRHVAMEKSNGKIVVLPESQVNRDLVPSDKRGMVLKSVQKEFEFSVGPASEKEKVISKGLSFIAPAKSFAMATGAAMKEEASQYALEALKALKKAATSGIDALGSKDGPKPKAAARAPASRRSFANGFAPSDEIGY